MNVTWTCPFSGCTHRERTSPSVVELFHIHGRDKVALIPFKKERRPVGHVTAKRAKADTWDTFSEWIRRRDADENGYVQCVTCGKVDHWKKMQAGHFISRRHSSILFDERNVHPQCPHCNGPLHGNEIKYKEFILKKYGTQVLLELEWLKRQRCSLTTVKLTVLKRLYQKKLEEMG